MKQSELRQIIKEEIKSILHENNDVEYYLELVNTDKERLKLEKDSGAREEIMQNLHYNQKMLSKARREASKSKVEEWWDRDDTPIYDQEKSLTTEDEESLFKIDPDLAFKLYDILTKEVPQLKQKYPIKSAFFTFLNQNL